MCVCFLSRLSFPSRPPCHPPLRYYHADRLGVVVFQDAVQHFNYGGSPDFPAYPNEKINTTIFSSEWAKAITGRKNHPSIVQWDIFNEFEFTIKDWQPPSVRRNVVWFCARERGSARVRGCACVRGFACVRGVACVRACVRACTHGLSGVVCARNAQVVRDLVFP